GQPLTGGRVCGSYSERILDSTCPSRPIWRDRKIFGDCPRTNIVIPMLKFT
ncbi:unnamed protein product, partial [Cercopithifilaria johnstoni]